MNDKYNVIFEGKVLSEQDINIVKSRVLKQLKVPATQLEMFFSGQPIHLKKDISLSEALALRTKLEQLGLMVTVSASSILSLSIFQDEKKEKTSIRKSARSQVVPNVGNVRAEFEGKYDYDSYQQLSPIPKTFTIDPEGRFGRLSFLNAQLALLLVLSPLAILYFSLLYFLKTAEYSLLILSVFSAIYILFSSRIIILRLHDMNLSGWFVILFSLGKIPDIGWIIVAVLVVFLSAIPGTKGDNNYGAQPELGRKIGLVFVVIIPLILAILGYVEYQNIGKKKDVERSIKLMADLEYSIFEYHEKYKKLPTSIKNLSGWQEALLKSSAIERLDLVDNGVIKIFYKDLIKEGAYLQIAPHVDDTGIVWHCYATNLSDKLVPAQCLLEINESSKINDRSITEKL